jgi:hypothetical protein
MARLDLLTVSDNHKLAELLTAMQRQIEGLTSAMDFGLAGAGVEGKTDWSDDTMEIQSNPRKVGDGSKGANFSGHEKKITSAMLADPHQRTSLIVSLFSQVKTLLGLMDTNAVAHTNVPAEEIIAATAAGTLTYSGTLAETPVIRASGGVVFSDTDMVPHEQFIDDGHGVLTGSDGGSGTIDYDTGDWEITMNADPGNARVYEANYSHGINWAYEYDVINLPK